MATNFPTGLDDFTNYVDGTTIMEAATLNDMQFAIEALQAKVGVDSSATSTSHDYKLARTVNTFGDQTIAGVKTFSTPPLGVVTPNVYAGEESVTLPNGLILKQGTIASEADGSVTVTFGGGTPNPFPTAFVNGFACPAENFTTRYENVNVYTGTVDNMTIVGLPVAGKTIRWFAIGY